MDMTKDINKGVNAGIYDKKNWTPLQIIYGMWWRPKSMKALLKKNQTSQDIKDTLIHVYGSDLAQILARSRK